MNKIKTLQIISSILLLINIALIAFMVFNRGPKQGRQAPGKMVKEIFNFDESQMEKFKEFRDEHRHLGREISSQLKSTSKAFYNTIDPLQKEILLDSILSQSKEIYFNNEKHFNDIRSICKPEQITNMEKFIDELMEKQSSHPPKRKRRK